ncbi:hypothetical protein Q7P37_000111 [Cladosporium fusiforme]
MGRRKIEIKPIKDDRNRSVTFLKRKGGLFKKAHELSVLCSVDVAVIIFGHNKKLYEYSSGDINETIARFQYYGGAHEHKGPQDFADKGGGDDDDDDEAGEEDVGDARGTPDQHQMMQQQQQPPPGMQHHPAFQHVRHGTPQASPPMPNGAMPQFQRGPSPLPPGISRPSSRTSQHPMQHAQQHPPQHLRRTSSNLVPPGHPQHTQGPPQQPTYAYAPNQPFYNPQAAAQAQMQRPPPQASYPPPYPAQHAQHPHHPGVAQAMMQDNRRQSMPPTYPSQQPPPSQMQRDSSSEQLQPPSQRPSIASPQPQQQQQLAPPPPGPSPQPPQHQQFASPPIPQPKPLPAHAKHNSIFTPIDDSRSLLAQHWGTSGITEQARSDPIIKLEDGGPRSASIDVAAMNRDKANGVSPKPPAARPAPRSPQPPPPPQPPQRTASTPSAPMVGPPARASATQSDAKRPRLKVQIPSEASGDEGATATADSDAASTSQGLTSTAAQQQGQGPPSHVVLPPPSPSTNTLLSAGAQGPPNPFARPAPPMSTNPHAANRETIETPMSALPSRFMSDQLLPSPSAFYSEWGFGGRSGDSNMLPSPLNFQTPVVANGQGWREEDRKRSADEEAAAADPKRARS